MANQNQCVFPPKKILTALYCGIILHLRLPLLIVFQKAFLWIFLIKSSRIGDFLKKRKKITYTNVIIVHHSSISFFLCLFSCKNYMWMPIPNRLRGSNTFSNIKIPQKKVKLYFFIWAILLIIPTSLWTTRLLLAWIETAAFIKNHRRLFVLEILLWNKGKAHFFSWFLFEEKKSHR